jgi:flagellar biosynthesis protein FlhA
MATLAQNLSLSGLQKTLKRGELLFALGIIGILVALILPMPQWLLDIALAFSLAFSILVLMTVLFIERPLEFSSFPTVLLVSTMLRLALNVASTRLILTHGHEGEHAAGRVIEAFGEFVMAGNYVIGLIVFAILVIVNFVVITKGSGRIAEVSARFTLDAMPGKQMAIDADLSAGIINEEESKRRREILEEESNFFGAMDGAAKFVRGDAIAGLLITFINIIGGMIIGIAQKGLDFTHAAQTYTVLTVGDGLVSQMPALIISTGAGMLVSKVGTTGSAEKALFGQLSAYPTALGISSFLMGTLALVPGIPAMPFLMLAGAVGFLAWKVSENAAQSKEQSIQAAESSAAAASTAISPEQALAEVLRIDQIRLEIGYGLIKMVGDDKTHGLMEQIRILRKQLAGELGFVIPAVRIQDNLQLGTTSYAIYIKDLESARGDIRPNMLLVMNPENHQINMGGEPTREPTFGLPAMWVPQSMREEAETKGYTVVDANTVLTTHLAEIIKDNVQELLSFSEVQKILEDLERTHAKLLTDMIPTQISYSGVQRVLQNLLAERISIRDVATIMEGIAEACTTTRNLTLITEHVRTRLARQLSLNHLNSDGVLPLITLAPEWEKGFADSLVGEGDTRQLAMAPLRLQEFIRQVKQVFDQQLAAGETPVLLTTPMIRPYVRSVIERFRPATIVMSQNEIYPKVRLKTVAQIV